MLRAEFHHLARARHAQPRLQRSRLVIDPAVDHPAVVSGLVSSQSVFFFQHKHARPWKRLRHLHRKRHSHNPATDHQNVTRRSHKFKEES